MIKIIMMMTLVPYFTLFYQKKLILMRKNDRFCLYFEGEEEVETCFQ